MAKHGFPGVPDPSDIGKATRAEEQRPKHAERIRETFGRETTVEGSTFGWEERVDSAILNELYSWADQNKVSQLAIDQIYSTILEGMINDIRFGLFEEGDAIRKSVPAFEGFINDNIASRLQAEMAGTLVGMGRLWYTETFEGFEAMIQRARDFIGANTPIDLASVRPTGGRGRSGARGPTAEEIRNQFDIKQLAESVNRLNRGLVLEDHKDSLRLARDYVDAIVKTKGEVKIDFDTFVRERITATSRFKAIYRNKPEALEPEQYLAPYLLAARALARPGDADDLAIAGAQFGGTEEQFVSRLAREDSVTGSSSFINGLEARMRALNSVFKG